MCAEGRGLVIGPLFARDPPRRDTLAPFFLKVVTLDPVKIGIVPNRVSPMEAPCRTRGGGSKKGGGKNRGKDGGKNNAPKFEGYCGTCGRWGHKSADCWQKQQKDI